VQTLAHELGHAYHNALMNGLRPWQREYPMTLAETASTFAESSSSPTPSWPTPRRHQAGASPSSISA
jgi:hypothetical protein